MLIITRLFSGLDADKIMGRMRPMDSEFKIKTKIDYISASPIIEDYLSGVTTMIRSHRKDKLPNGLKYFGIEHFVHQNGQAYVSGRLDSEELDYLWRTIDRYGRRFPIKQCYYNSQLLMVMSDLDKRFTYVEGFCWNGIIPFHHGWLELNGKVIDTTLRLKNMFRGRRLPDRVLGEWKEPREYFGVSFDRKYVYERIIHYNVGGSLIDNWQDNYPLLCGLDADKIINRS